MTITAIDGQRVHFEPALEWDHDTPREDLKTAVANYSRTITFANLRGDEAPVHQRAHVMFMHNQNIDVRYASFWHLGRTDKSRRADAVERLDDLEGDTNIQGRYSFHFHRTGIENVERPAIALGNAVFGSPGWGFVHHDSHAIFHDNASFNTFGAGFVAETGNETGTWTRNIAIAAQGNSATNPKNGVDISIFDIARTGSGFWFQGRMVRAVDNVAASVNQGYAYFHRDSSGTMIRFPADRWMFPDALELNPNSAGNHPPILHFHGNEAFASTVGLIVVKANPNQRHDVRSWMSDFLAWSVITGAELEYTSHYTLENFELIGQRPEPFRSARTGIVFGNNTSDMVVMNSRVEGFETGVRLGKHFTANMGGETVPPEANTNVLIDVELVDVNEEFSELDLAVDLVLESDDLEPGRMEFHFQAGELSYSAAQHTGRSTPFRLTKVDSIGAIELPAGTDSLGVGMQQMIRILEQQGFYRDDQGRPLVIVREYFSDRTTGDVHKVPVPVWLDDDVPLQNQYFPYRDALDRGSIDLSLAPPEVPERQITTSLESEVAFDGLEDVSSGSDRDLEISAVFQPRHGDVFWSPEGELRYRPDFGFRGSDRFVYWVHDGHGGFGMAAVDVEVR